MTTSVFKRAAGWYLVPRSAGGYISHFVPDDQQRALCGASMVFGRVRYDTAVVSCRRCLHIFNECCPLCRRAIRDGEAVRYDITSNRACHEACVRRQHGK